MPVVLVIIVSIVLVTAARLRRRCDAGVARLDARSGGRRLGVLVARGFSARAITACVLLLTGVATVGLPAAQTPHSLVYVVPIEGMIDLGVAPLLARTSAKRSGPAPPPSCSTSTRSVGALTWRS